MTSFRLDAEGKSAKLAAFGAKGAGFFLMALCSASCSTSAFAQVIANPAVGSVRSLMRPTPGTAPETKGEAQPGAAPAVSSVFIAPQSVVVGDPAAKPVPSEVSPPNPMAQLLPLLDDMPDTLALTGGLPLAYRPVPIRLRSLRLAPSITVAGGYNRLSAVDKASSTTGPETQITPELEFNNGDAVNRIKGSLHYTNTRYYDARANDTDTFASSLWYERGVPEIALFRLHGSTNYNALPRFDINNQPGTRGLVRYWDYLAEADLSHHAPVLGWRLNMAVDRKLFSPSVDAQTGSIVDQSRRSNARWSMTGVVTHQIEPGLEAVVSVEGNRHDYDVLRNLGTVSRPMMVSANSNGYAVMAGVNLQWSNRLMGTVQLGYMAQNFEDHRIQNIAGLSYKVDLLYLFDAKANLRLSAIKRIDESSSYTSPGRRRTNVDLTYSRFLKENWRASLTGSLDYFDYMSAGRQPHGYGGSASSRFMLNRNLSLVTEAEYYRREAGLPQDQVRYLTVMQGIAFMF